MVRDDFSFFSLPGSILFEILMSVSSYRRGDCSRHRDTVYTRTWSKTEQLPPLSSMWEGVFFSVPADGPHEHTLGWETAQLPLVREAFHEKDQHGGAPARPHRWEAVLLPWLRGQLRSARLPAKASAPTRCREAPPLLGVRPRIHSAPLPHTARTDAHRGEAILLPALPQTLRLQERVHRSPEDPQRGEAVLLLTLWEGLFHVVVVQESHEPPQGAEITPLLSVRQELQPAGAAEEAHAETCRSRTCGQNWRCCELGEWVTEPNPGSISQIPNVSLFLLLWLPRRALGVCGTHRLMFV